MKGVDWNPSPYCENIPCRLVGSFAINSLNSLECSYPRYLWVSVPVLQIHVSEGEGFMQPHPHYTQLMINRKWRGIAVVTDKVFILELTGFLSSFVVPVLDLALVLSSSATFSWPWVSTKASGPKVDSRH